MSPGASTVTGPGLGLLGRLNLGLFRWVVFNELLFLVSEPGMPCCCGGAFELHSKTVEQGGFQECWECCV